MVRCATIGGQRALSGPAAIADFVPCGADRFRLNERTFADADMDCCHRSTISRSELGSRLTIKDAATLALNGKVYRLDGIDAPELDQTCLDDKGATWPCGIAARDQLNEFISKRAVQCDDKGPDTTYRSRRIGMCRVEGEGVRLNQWLVRNGWALNFEPYAKGRSFFDQARASGQPPRTLARLFLGSTGPAAMEQEDRKAPRPMPRRQDRARCPVPRSSG